jgi:hypothetical protein
MEVWGRILKSESAEDGWIIEGIASTPDIDLQGDQIPLESLDLSYFVGERPLTRAVTQHNRDKPWVDYDHGYEISKDDNPDLVAGEPIEAKVTPEGLYVKLKLYKNKLGQKIYENIQEFTKWGWPRRYGLSVSGLAKRNNYDRSVIDRFIPLSVAVTPRPVNTGTWTELSKSRRIREERCMMALDWANENLDADDQKLFCKFKLSPDEASVIRPYLHRRRQKALTTSSSTGQSITIQDLEDELHVMWRHLAQWKRLHPEDPHLTWGGYFNDPDAVEEHFSACEKWPYSAVVEAMSVLRNSVLLDGNQQNLL